MADCLVLFASEVVDRAVRVDDLDADIVGEVSGGDAVLKDGKTDLDGFAGRRLWDGIEGTDSPASSCRGRAEADQNRERCCDRGGESGDSVMRVPCHVCSDPAAQGRVPSSM